MPSLDRPLRGQALRFRLDDYLPGPDDVALARSGRNARTLAKHDALRVVLIALAAGGGIAEHQADGPLTVHVLRGGIRFQIGDKEHRLEAGDLLSLDGKIRHSVHSDEGGAFLLTIASA